MSVKGATLLSVWRYCNGTLRVSLHPSLCSTVSNRQRLVIPHCLLSLSDLVIATSFFFLSGLANSVRPDINDARSFDAILIHSGLANSVRLDYQRSVVLLTLPWFLYSGLANSVRPDYQTVSGLLDTALVLIFRTGKFWKARHLPSPRHRHFFSSRDTSKFRKTRDQRSAVVTTPP